MQNAIASHNAANELRTRDTDRNSSVDCTLTHDAVGNLTDDGKDYSYVSDAFGRLKRVKNRGSSAVVAEYTCNGQNMRIDWHTSYGIPIRIDPGDYNRDGYVNGNDLDDDGDDFDNARSEADVNFDGDVDEDDYDLFSAWWDAPSTAGRFTLSASSVANRFGYAGYQHDPTFVGASRAIYHIRNRVYDAGLGRWTRRDPIGYVDGDSLMSYVSNRSSVRTDATGNRYNSCMANEGCSTDPGNECTSGYGEQKSLPVTQCDRCWTQACDRHANGAASGISGCCGKNKISCLRAENEERKFPDHQADRCYGSLRKKCVFAHEDKHRDEFTCNDNISSGWSPRCAKNRWDKVCGEWRATEAEKACIQANVFAECVKCFDQSDATRCFEVAGKYFSYLQLDIMEVGDECKRCREAKEGSDQINDGNVLHD